MAPILEVYVLWHPDEEDAAKVADEIVAHFHGGVYATLLAGSMEVYVRSVSWRIPGGAPRPIPWPGLVTHSGETDVARFVAVVPIVGLALNRAVNQAGDPWRVYFEEVVEAQKGDPEHVRLLPLRIDSTLDGRLVALLSQGRNQFIGESDPLYKGNEPIRQVRCRDLAQGLAQWVSPQSKLTVFISHTKRQGTPEEPVASLVEAVVKVLSTGRVGSFYDAHELQPAEDWDEVLRSRAGSSALLAVRTDLYATREWCQREVLSAKERGMPVVVLDSLTVGETRGSFLMDHTPRIPMRKSVNGDWNLDTIRRAVNLLADAWLQRVLWLQMKARYTGHATLGRYWWAPQAPEPSTLMSWLQRANEMQAAGTDGETEASHARVAGDKASDKSLDLNPPRIPVQPPGSEVRILYPDPPLAADECDVLARLTTLAGYGHLDLATPRMLAARGACTGSL